MNIRSCSERSSYRAVQCDETKCFIRIMTVTSNWAMGPWWIIPALGRYPKSRVWCHLQTIWCEQVLMTSFLNKLLDQSHCIAFGIREVSLKKNSSIELHLMSGKREPSSLRAGGFLQGPTLKPNRKPDKQDNLQLRPELWHYHNNNDKGICLKKQPELHQQGSLDQFQSVLPMSGATLKMNDWLTVETGNTTIF